MNKLLIILLLAMLSACSTTPRHPSSSGYAADEEMDNLVMYALSLADTPYRYGGNSPDSGFDCSGFVDHVFSHTLGVKLPRTSHEISRVGKPVSNHNLRPGDLVFFNTMHRPYSHVGIFIGDGKFVHAPKTGSNIRVEQLNEKYWAARYNGARRIKV